MSLVAGMRALSPQRKPTRRVAAVATPPARPVLPAPMVLVTWRQSAEARLEGALAEMDHRLVQGEAPRQAMAQVVDTYLLWTRRSVARFTTSPAGVAEAPTAEMRHWQGVADQVIEDGQPELVERFLRIWLAVIHEAAASGQATLYALSQG